MILEFDSQEEDFQSIQKIYRNIEESHNAALYSEDLERLVTFTETFQTKWKETRNKIDIYKSYLLNRVAIYNEWLNEVTLMNVWVDNIAKKIQETKPSIGECEAETNNVSIACVSCFYPGSSRTCFLLEFTLLRSKVL